VFSPIFIEAKRRLKCLLNNKTIYTDGMKPDDIARLLRNYEKAKCFYANDLTKQDRQTDEPLIDVEMEIYKILGVDQEVLAYWR